jgi:hypothetical protein
MDYLCTCVCHTDPTKHHCDELSCMPCCTVCKECGGNIEFGKLRSHTREAHNIEMPPASPQKLKELENLLNFAEGLFHGEGNE